MQMSAKTIAKITETSKPLLRNYDVASVGELKLQQRGTGMTRQEWREFAMSYTPSTLKRPTC